MDSCDDDCDEEALRLAALQSLQKPKFINTHNLIPITTNPFSGVAERRVKLEPISPSREQTFVDEKRNRATKKTEDDDDDDDSLEGLINQLQASIDGTANKKISEQEEVEFLDVKTDKRTSSKEIIILESPPLSPRPTYRSRSRSRRRSPSWSRSPRLKRYSRSPSPRYRRRRSKSWSASPSPRKRSPYRSPRRWSRSPRRRRSRSPISKKRSLSPWRSPRRRSRSFSPVRNRTRSPVNRARKRDSPVWRRSPSPRRRHRPRKRSEEKVEEHLDPVLEARRKKFESLPNENKKISLKAVKNTIEPVSETGVDIRLDVLSDDSEDSDGQEGRFKCNSQPQTRGKLLSFRSIREGNTVVPPPRLEQINQKTTHHRPERIRLKKARSKRAVSPKVAKRSPSPKLVLKKREEIEKVVERVSPVKKLDVGRISVKKDLFPSEKIENKIVEEAEPDLRSILAKKRKERMGTSNLLPLGSRLVQSALQHLGEPKVKQQRRILVVDNSQLVTVQPQSRSVSKRRVRKVQDLEPILLLAEDSDPDEEIRPHKRKVKAKRSVTIASQRARNISM